MDLSTVDATIEAAFLDVERDKDCTLHQAQLLDQTMSREISEAEWRAAKDQDQEIDGSVKNQTRCKAKSRMCFGAACPAGWAYSFRHRHVLYACKEREQSVREFSKWMAHAVRPYSPAAMRCIPPLAAAGSDVLVQMI